MRLRKFFLLLFILSLDYNLASAGGLASKEAINYYREGLKAQQAYNFIAAEAAYQKVLLLDSADPALRKFSNNNLGAIYVEEGDLKKAEACFKTALETDPDYKTAQLNLGLIYEKSLSRQELLEYWAKVFEKLIPKNFIIEGEPGREEK